MNFIESIHFYSLILAIGASIALWQVAMSSPAAQRLHWMLAGLMVMLGALLGARIAYILEHLHYYSLYPQQIIKVWQGGLSWIGAVPGALLLILPLTKIWQWRFWHMADRLSVMLLPLGMAGWLACLFEGSAYGTMLPAGTWWGIQALDESGAYALRIPLQPLAALSLLTFLGMAEILLRKNAHTGLRSSVLILIFSADMLLFSFMRADAAQTWLGLRIESWAAIITTFAALLSTIRCLVQMKFFPSIRWSKKKPILESKPL